MNFKYTTFTDAGPYPENQDALTVSMNQHSLFACIADGVGGARNGKKASFLAVQEFKNCLENNSSIDLFELTNYINNQLLSIEADGVLTTFSGINIDNNTLYGTHVGDTRVYLLRNNGIKQLTEDHTEFFRLYKSGKLSPEDAEDYPRKHILENSLGLKLNFKVDEFSYQLEHGDRIILSTDGVHNLISKKTFRDLSKAAKGIEEFSEFIQDEVIGIGPKDNFSFVIIEVL